MINLKKKLSITTNEIALMGLLLAFYIVIKYIINQIFSGPFHFSVEILFWIINGILFYEIKGSLFSILCDTIFLTFNSGFAYWMIEYAMVPPLISIISSWIWSIYNRKNGNLFIFLMPIFIMLLLLGSSLAIFFIQLKKSSFYYEMWSKGIKQLPWIPYILISMMSLFVLLSLLSCLILFFKTKNWKYVRILYIMSIVIIVVIIFRWLWGPYAYCAYLKRFSKANVDFVKQYPITLFGIVTKSFITIPLACFILTPLLRVIERYSKRNDQFNKF